MGTANWLVLDVYNNTSYDFLKKSMRSCVYEIYPPKVGNKYIQWLIGVIISLLKSKKGDTIIFVYDLQAVLLWWLCRFFMTNRNIICVNLLLDRNKRIRNKAVTYLYKKALLSKSFYATVSSEEYGKWLNRTLCINAKYTLLRDVYHDDYDIHYNGNVEKRVFCGGRNGRDWNFLISVAQQIPEIGFTIVMPRGMASQYKTICPPNCLILEDIPYEDFMKEMCRSSLVCLPLTKEAPAGLIVMFQAAANKKMVLTTRTATTNEYYSNDRGVLLEKNVCKWRDAIKKYITDEFTQNIMAENMYKYVKMECSEEYYCKTIEKIIMSL
jgi:glycosyltransferase involved in cell wall biosynthesis